jgi:hypothetical protein
MRLDELFELRNGVAINVKEVQITPGDGLIPYVRPASTQRRTVAGWVDRSLVSSEHLYPPNSLFVSTNGEGSHSYSYVSQFEFIPNTDVTVLIPRRPMGLAEKIYFAKCITMNRYRFSYGRKPKGARLGSILVPNAAPEWVSDDAGRDAIKIFAGSIEGIESGSLPPVLLGTQTVEELFEIHSGNGLSRSKLKVAVAGEGVNFVARGQIDNGVVGRVIAPEGEKVWSGGLITVALSGSVLSTFVQPEPFVTAFHVAVLVPRRLMKLSEKLWWARCIAINQYRYNYGRQANRTLSGLKIPLSAPQWVASAPQDAVSDLRGDLMGLADGKNWAG